MAFQLLKHHFCFICDTLKLSFFNHLASQMTSYSLGLCNKCKPSLFGLFWLFSKSLILGIIGNANHRPTQPNKIPFQSTHAVKEEIVLFSLKMASNENVYWKNRTVPNLLLCERWKPLNPLKCLWGVHVVMMSCFYSFTVLTYLNIWQLHCNLPPVRPTIWLAHTFLE